MLKICYYRDNKNIQLQLELISTYHQPGILKQKQKQKANNQPQV